MNDRERKICGQVKALREKIKWSQPDFAKELGITRDQLANIEYGRSPVRYPLAVTICQVFDVSGRWLATGQGKVQGSQAAIWVTDFNPSKYANSLFSSVYDQQPDLFKSQSQTIEDWRQTPTPGFDPEAWLMKHVYYWFNHHRFKSALDAENFSRSVRFYAEATLEAYIASGISINRKWPSNSFPFIPGNPLDPQKKELTYKTTSENLNAMKPLWPDRKREIQSAVAKPGGKSALAKFLGVDLTQLSKWLSDSKSAREPGAEYALKMLYWVEHPELQK